MDDQDYKNSSSPNRAEIACASCETSERDGIETVAVYSGRDRDALHCVWLMKRSIGPLRWESYLVIDKSFEAPKAWRRCGSIPVRFLLLFFFFFFFIFFFFIFFFFFRLKPRFVRACQATNIISFRPVAEAMEAMGPQRMLPRTVMTKAASPSRPAIKAIIRTRTSGRSKAQEIGYPVLIKSRRWGRCKGMRKVERSRRIQGRLRLRSARSSQPVLAMMSS